MKCDFHGYVTKYDVQCTDGVVISHAAFSKNDGKVVPLCWMHFHQDPDLVLGKVLLEDRPDGVYGYGSFNDTKAGKNAKEFVRHGDIKAVSIFANQLVKDGPSVLQGDIKEVSLVIGGANPEARIESVTIEHSDGSYEDLDDEAIIYNGLNILTDEIKHLDPLADEESIEHAEDDDDTPSDDSDPTMQEVYNSLTDVQKDFVYAMMAAAVAEEVDGIENLSEGDDNSMRQNLFDPQAINGNDKTTGAHLSHSQIKTIFDDAVKMGSLRDSFLAHATEYGIENIDVLFPDAKTITPTPELVSRDMTWVPVFLNGASHSPFSRIKSTSADITADEARAKGYTKGNLKKEEFFALAKRITTPTTVYKKQKLDRDDVIDITDLNVVAFLKQEMRTMLNEEVARAGLIGDGRDVENDDKIDENCIRPIYKDDDFYAYHFTVGADATPDAIIEAIIRNRKEYKRPGNPIMFTTEAVLTDMLLLKDKVGRRIYRTESELASELRVSRIVTVEPMEGVSREVSGANRNLLAIFVNPTDYRYGADKGGNVSMFDDFDIDYNQYKYLIETRCSGALFRPRSALVLEQTVNP